MNTGERYEFNKDLDYRLTRAYKKSSILNSLNSHFAKGHYPLATFINPAAALSAVGAGLGAVKGGLEQDPYGQYISGQDRLNRIALNSLGGGLIGGATGLGGKQLYKLGQDANLPQNIDNVRQALPQGRRATNVPAAPQPVNINPIEAGDRLLDLESTANNRASNVDNIRKQASERQKRAKILKRSISEEQLARQQRLEAIKDNNRANQENFRQAVSGIVDDVKATVYDTPIVGPRVQGLVEAMPVWRKKVGPEVPVPKPSQQSADALAEARAAEQRALTAERQQLYDESRQNLNRGLSIAGEVATEFAPDVDRAAQGALNVGRKVKDTVVERSKKDIDKVKGWLGNRFKKPQDNSIDNTFSFMDNNIARFGVLPNMPITTDEDAYRLAAGLGAVGGGTLLGLNTAADTIYQQRFNDNKNLADIMQESDPGTRLRRYKEYTENPDLALRQVGDNVGLLGNTALATGAGAVGGGLLSGGSLLAYQKMKGLRR